MVLIQPRSVSVPNRPAVRQNVGEVIRIRGSREQGAGGRFDLSQNRVKKICSLFTDPFLLFRPFSVISYCLQGLQQFTQQENFAQALIVLTKIQSFQLE